jgi:hypothetical protein
MDGKTLRYIRALRKLGASRVEIEGVVVEFKDGVESPPVAGAPSQPKTVRQELDDAIREAQELMDDQREVMGIEEKARKREELESLRYAHS